MTDSDILNTITYSIETGTNEVCINESREFYLNIIKDPVNAKNMLGKTAYYDPEQREIHIYTTDRHPKDIMRSISHELVHHHQNCKGDFAGDHYSGEGYAQKDPHMRKMEQEAYLQGNMCFRDWEDRHKKLKEQVYNEWRTNTMSLKEWKNKELFGLLSKKWGFGKNLVTEAKEDDPNRPDDVLKKQLEDAGIDTTGMSKKDIDKKAAMLRLGNPEKYTALEEELEEAKGEKGDADPLDGERVKFDKDLDGIPDGGDPNPDDPDNPDAKKK